MKSFAKIRLTAPSPCRAASCFCMNLACALTVWSFISGSTSAAVLEGTQPKDWPANPAKHEVVVKREAANEKQTAMITAAEAALPSKQGLLEAAGDNKLPEDVKLWWYKEELGIRIPYAITADTVVYFSELVGKYGKQVLNRFVEPSSRLEYHAGVKFHKEFKLDEKTFHDVHVVTLKLTFNQHFAATQTEGMNFEKVRVVVIDAAGKVLHISGDGPTEVPILAI